MNGRAVLERERAMGEMADYYSDEWGIDEEYDQGIDPDEFFARPDGPAFGSSMDDIVAEAIFTHPKFWSDD